MSKIFKEGNYSITRDLKIDENAKNNYIMSEAPLKSVTQKFLKEPLTLETFDKKFRQMNNDNNKKEQDLDTEAPKKKTKRQEGKAIFYDIFIKPKEQKIKEIIDKRNKKTKAAVTTKQIEKTYISNKINSDGKILGMNGQGPQIQFDFRDFTTNKPIEELDAIKTETEIKLTTQKNLKTSEANIPPLSEKKFKNTEILQKNFDIYFKKEKNVDISLLNTFLHDKYILNKNSPDTTKKNYFNQLIQIRPPEGINAVVASPLMESKGWAPSIPSVNIDKLNTNLKDLMIRAKGGIKNNDIIKEAHMAFYLGIMNEEEKKYESALKFYKKYFLSTKLLQDIYGTELALNRIAVLFSNIFDFEQSIYYNEKHKEITTHNLNGFVAYYNCGICYRVLENFEKSIENFQQALKMSEEESDLESYTLCLAQLAICFIFIGDIDAFIEHSNEFSEKNKSLGHIEMDLEIQILSGYVYNYKNDLDKAKDFYKSSLQNSLLCENERYKHVSLCNIGIIEADKHIDDFWANLGDPELSKNIDFTNYENNELIEELQEQEEQKDVKQIEDLHNDQQNEPHEKDEEHEHEELDNAEQVNGNNEGEYEGQEGQNENGEGENVMVGNKIQNENEEYEENEGHLPPGKRGYSAGDNVGYSEPNQYDGNEQDMEGEVEPNEQDMEGEPEGQYMEGEGDPNEQDMEGEPEGQYMEGEGDPNEQEMEGNEQYQGDADDIEDEQEQAEEN
jgi:tetratricopeptide (TPR) repeat protein